MKSLILLLLSLSLPIHAAVTFGTGRVTGSIRANPPYVCTTECDSIIIDKTPYSGGGVDSFGTGYSGMQIDITNGTIVTEYLVAATQAAENGSLRISLYTDVTNGVGVLVEGTSSTNTWDKFPAYPTLGTVAFPLAVPKAGLSGKYWIVMEHDAGYFIYGYAFAGGQRIVSPGFTGYADNCSLTLGLKGCYTYVPPVTNNLITGITATTSETSSDDGRGFRGRPLNGNMVVVGYSAYVTNVYGSGSVGVTIHGTNGNLLFYSTQNVPPTNGWNPVLMTNTFTLTNGETYYICNYPTNRGGNIIYGATVTHLDDMSVETDTYAYVVQESGTTNKSGGPISLIYYKP